MTAFERGNLAVAERELRRCRDDLDAARAKMLAVRANPLSQVDGLSEICCAIRQVRLALTEIDRAVQLSERAA